MPPILDNQNVIDKASIIENKERTKIYWEQLMMAAANENKSPGKVRNWSPPADSSGVRYGDDNRNPDRNGSSSFCWRDRKDGSDLDGNDCRILPCRNCGSVYKNSNSQNNIIEKQARGNYDADWDSESELVNRKNDKNEKPLPKERSKENYSLTMEGKIALELQEMKEREEELKEWRNKIANENCKEASLSKDGIVPTANEELSSFHTTDESNYSEYGSEEKEHSLDDNGSRVNTPYSEDFMHARTRSLDSVSSGHSSGSGSAVNEREGDSFRRKVIVRPYEDPEEETTYSCYSWDGKETPIEREIRLAMEREEELRREKGTAAVIENCRAFVRKSKDKVEIKKGAVENDPRGIQHKLATSRIQQEIEEANERERELRTEGKIKSTSEETIDAKVTRLPQLVENSILENRHREQQKVKRSSQLGQTPNNRIMKERPVEERLQNGEKTFSKRSNTSKKGVMEQFFSSKGNPFAAKMNVQYQAPGEEFQSKTVIRPSFNSSGDAVVHTRKGYTPVSEKIQKELKDVQKREEELRSQRARCLARSQPDLLAMLASEEEEEDMNWEGQGERFTESSKLHHSISNPNLLDDSYDKVHKRSSSKKFSLLEEWEKRIRENNGKN